MFRWIQVSLILATLLTQTAVHATKLSDKEYQMFTNGRPKVARKELSRRRGGNPYINIAKGIFDSRGGNLIQNVANIPCETIQTLESDADEAEQFVSQIQAGQVPSIIANLPEEAVSQFADIIGVVTMVVDVAEAAVTDVINIFDDIEDGSITSDLAAIPTDIVNAITNGWNDFTDEVESVWGDVTCFFEGGCSSSTAGFCSLPSSAPASAMVDPAGASYTSAYYASYWSSESAAAAAYTSAYYASYASSESSAEAAYTSEYYALYYSSESSATSAAAAAVVSTPEQSTNTIQTVSTATPDTIAPSSLQTQTQPNSQELSQTQMQSTEQSTPQPSQSSPSTPSSSKGSISHIWADSYSLAISLLTILGIALWL